MLAMMLPYSFHDDVSIESVPEAETTIKISGAARKRTTKEVHFILDKVTVPMVDNLVERPRISEFLLKTSEQFGANLISGRAQTGKTYAAVDLAGHYKNVGWYSIEPGDIEWTVFAKYLSAAVGATAKIPEAPESKETVAAFLTEIMAAVSKRSKKGTTLVVLDDLQHIFDAEWFPDVFTLLLSSVPSNVRLLFLCRSKPPVPLWRLRSKQVLNVVDERMLAFDDDEIFSLCRKLGAPEQASQNVPASAFGRAGKVAEFLRSSTSCFDSDAPRNTLDPVFLANIDPFVP